MDNDGNSNEQAFDELGEPQRRAEDETRREILKRFGRYAAVAPAAMVLLASREAAAPPPWGYPGPPPKTPPEHAGGYD